ncbi:MAG TPA: dihydrolipoyl dehydrogenase [Myxococcales bacterium]|nr:dihydrolipoyl dehydrogenase [Myxococcales bacterium]HIM00691.1 dihydrolipoyl dehydrogenase [Myxococcales bacterium]
MSVVEIRVPDIGEFDHVEVIEVLVSPGDTVEVEQSLITLESDKATMEIPSTQAGTVQSIAVAIGGNVSEGDVILRLDAAGAAPEPAPADAAADSKTASIKEEPAKQASPPTEAPVSQEPLPDADIRADVVVLGAGPGGYTAAFRAADLGKNVVLVERYDTLGGVCLNVGCIPSKALLHLAEVMTEVRTLGAHGVEFGEPTLDLDKVRAFKDSVVTKLTGGLSGLAKRRKVTVVQGKGSFAGPNLITVDGPDGTKTIAFHNAIIAAGSSAVAIPTFPNDDPRLMDSTDALALDEIPGRMLVVGGGIIGLELASVFSALGTKITVVELLDQLMTGADPDLVKPFQKIISSRYENIFTGTKVNSIEAKKKGLVVTFEGKDAPATDVFDRVLVAVGRKPNGNEVAAENAGVHVDEHGFIPVDNQLRTNVSHIFAIGDIVGPPMLAHKATHEGKTAAEVMDGQNVVFEPTTIPSVAYTDPEVAWMGLTELEAKKQNIEIRKASFPWAASGRALGIGRSEGVTKLLLDPESGRVLGAGIVGPHAGDLIAELVLALELGADAEDLALTIHAHPTLSETSAMAAEMAEGTITDLYVPRR